MQVGGIRSLVLGHQSTFTMVRMIAGLQLTQNSKKVVDVCSNVVTFAANGCRSEYCIVFSFSFLGQLVNLTTINRIVIPFIRFVRGHIDFHSRPSCCRSERESDVQKQCTPVSPSQFGQPIRQHLPKLRCHPLERTRLIEALASFGELVCIDFQSRPRC